MSKRVVFRPRLGRAPDGRWTAEYTGWDLRAEGATKEEAIESLKRAYDEVRRTDAEAWRNRLVGLFDDPPPDWEVVEEPDR